MSGDGSQVVRPRHVAAFAGMIAALLAAEVLIDRLRPPWWVGAVLLAGCLGALWWSATRPSRPGSGRRGSFWARALTPAAEPRFVLAFVPFMAAQRVFALYWGWFVALLIVVAFCVPFAAWASARQKKSGKPAADVPRADAPGTAAAARPPEPEDTRAPALSGVADAGPPVVVGFDRGSVHPGDGNIPTGFELPATATVVDLLIAMSEASGTVFVQIVGGCRWLVEQVLDDGGKRLIGTVDYFDDWRSPPVIGVCYGSPYEHVPLAELLGPSIRLEATHVYAKEAGIIKADARGYTGAGITRLNYDW